MASCSGADKENAAPLTSAAATAVVPRRHGYGVRSCGVKKRPCRARWTTPRVPLRDITNLVAAGSAAEGLGAPLGQNVSPAVAELKATPDVVVVVPAAQGGAAGGAAAKKAAAPPARYSLRKEFR